MEQSHADRVAEAVQVPLRRGDLSNGHETHRLLLVYYQGSEIS